MSQKILTIFFKTAFLSLKFFLAASVVTAAQAPGSPSSQSMVYLAVAPITERIADNFRILIMPSGLSWEGSLVSLVFIFHLILWEFLCTKSHLWQIRMNSTSACRQLDSISLRLKFGGTSKFQKLEFPAPTFANGDSRHLCCHVTAEILARLVRC